MYSVILLPGSPAGASQVQRAPRSALAAWLESLLALGSTTAGPLGPPDSCFAILSLSCCCVIGHYLGKLREVDGCLHRPPKLDPSMRLYLT